MSFLAWDARAPRGFGRLRGYHAGLSGLGQFTLPTPSIPLPSSISTTISDSQLASQTSVAAPVWTATPPPVTDTGNRLTTTDNVVEQVARAGERVADQSMQSGMDATQSAGNSSTDAIMPTPSADAIADQIMPMAAPRGLPWWVFFGGGALGGVLLVSIFGR